MRLHNSIKFIRGNWVMLESKSPQASSTTTLENPFWADKILGDILP